MSDGPLDPWLDVTDWSAEITCSVTDDHDITSSTDPDKVVGTSRTRWQVVASGRLGPPRFSWGGDGVLSASWDEESNIDESGEGWIQYARGTASGSGTGTGTISLAMGTHNGEGIYIIRASGLYFDVTVTTWTYSKDPVTGIPSEGFIASTGRREVFFPRVDDVLPRSGLALKGNKQVQLSGSGIANVSWSLIPLLAGPCKITSISPTTVTLFTGVAQTFTANGKGLAGVKWKAPGATPAAPPESGPTFTTKWRRAGKKTVTATCGGTTKTAKVRVLDVLIDINKTRATNDDIVQVKCNHPERRFEVPCTIRLSKDSKNLATGPVKLVLTDPTGRLRFPGEFDFTRTVDLPANGDPVTFHITGQQASEKKGDAEIEARLNTATGPIVKKKNVTVFTFDNAKMEVTEGGNYTLKDGLYFVPDDVAVSFKATATLTPPGLHCRAPQIRDLRVAIMQEISFFFARIEFGSPNFVPEPEVHGVRWSRLSEQIFPRR